MELHDHIWNHHEKCIQISTNMPGIGLVNPEIAVKMSEVSKKACMILLSKTNARVLKYLLSYRQNNVVKHKRISWTV